MRFSRPVGSQNPRTFEARRDASNGTCVCHSGTNVVFSGRFSARSFLQSVLHDGEAVRLHP